MWLAFEVVAWMDPVHLSTSPGKLRWQPSLLNAPTLYFNFTPNIIPWSPIPQGVTSKLKFATASLQMRLQTNFLSQT